MSLRRAIKAFGFKDFVKMGFAVATAKKINVARSPKNESQSSQFVMGDTKSEKVLAQKLISSEQLLRFHK